MTENRSHRSGEDLDPRQPIAESPSVAVRASSEPGDTVLTELTAELRVVRSPLQWILQSRIGGAKSWKNIAFCGTKEGLRMRIEDFLLKEHLSKFDLYQVQRVKIYDVEGGRHVQRSVVSKKALQEAEAARELLKRGFVSSLGIAPEAWAVIEALPAYFPKG